MYTPKYTCNTALYTRIFLLYKGCIEDFRRQNPSRSLVSLKNGLVKLEGWHFSTVVQCSAHKSHSLFGSCRLTLPLAIQASKITFVGADDCNIFGEPTDLNRQSEVLRTIRLYMRSVLMCLSDSAAPQAAVISNRRRQTVTAPIQPCFSS
jgi:hypothetical protein